MNLINAELSHEKMMDLFRSLHFMYFNYKEDFDRTHLVERICKCHNMDVKILLKMYITYSGDDSGNFAVSVKISASSTSINLRKTKNYFGDEETFTIVKEFQKNMNPDQLGHAYSVLITQIINSYKVFKVCKYCRILYRDPRIDVEPDHACMNCLFDQVFYIRDLTCAVCSESIHKDDMNFTLTCGHTYHTSCILKSFIQMKKRECPLCRELDYHDPTF